MTPTEIGKRVTTLVFGMAPEPRVKADRSLRLIEDLGYTSLRLIELATELSLEFEFEPIAGDDVAVATVDDVIALVTALLPDHCN